jgi:hypothetical protein
MELVHQANHARNREHRDLNLAENAIFSPAEFFDLFDWTIPQEMTQDIGALSAIENKVQLGVGDIASEYVQKQPP